MRRPIISDYIITFGDYRRNATTSMIRRAANAPIHILDIGCGHGETTHELKNTYPQADVTGLDLERENVMAARRLTPDLNHVQGDGGKLPFSDHSFDMIVMLEVIEHFTNPRALLSEARRTMKRTGVLVLSTPNPNSLTACTGRMMRRIMRLPAWNAWDTSHQRLYSPGDLADLLRAEGFEVCDMRGFWPLPDGFQKLPRGVGEQWPIRAFTKGVWESGFMQRSSFITIAVARLS